MMGTGEATGDRRAILAAEAAIANPLLDEVSMKGARGLLISITGGNDLTLYEVDEAAGRIRQEVDEDANIILGATFDSSLDGIVRVSVVATGIDHPVGAYELNAAETRITEVANRLRAQTAARGEAGQAAHQAVDAYAPARREAFSNEERIAPVAAPNFGGAANGPQHAAYAPELAQAHHYGHAPQAREPDDYFEQSPFIPSAPESPVIRQQRMPQIDDLPLPGQNQMRAHRGELQGQAHPEAKRRSLLERLASFGTSRQEEAGGAPAPYERQAAQSRPQAQPAPAQRPQAPNPIHAEYGKRTHPPAPQRPAPPQHEPHGRSAYQPRQSEEDQLEIPAFLRRQSS
jgi:cell division protein FtsZ